MSEAIPVHPDKQTFSVSVVMSQKCQKATFVALLDYFIGPPLRLSECDSERLRGLEVEG